MNINTNHNLLAFDREIDNSKNWFQSRIAHACGYPAGVLLDRLIQRLIEISLYPYSLAVSHLCKTSANCFPVDGTQIDGGRAFLEIGTGKITITARQLLANQLDFLLHWSYCLFAIFLVKRTNHKDLRAVLVFGVGEESLFVDKSDERFVDYCRLGPVEPLRKGRRFLVQSISEGASSSSVDFFYCKRPLIALLREAKLGLSGRFYLLRKHLSLFFAYQFAVFRLPQLSLLGKDFAYSAISSGLDRLGQIESIVITISSYTYQPLWMRELNSAKVHMVWYAQNFKPVTFADKLESDIPGMRWIRVDVHWVWTHAFAEYLRSLGHDKAIEVVGPIVWYRPETDTGKAPQNVIEILVFDVSPSNDDYVLHDGHIINYLRPENLIAFVRDVIALKSRVEESLHLPVSLRLKTKRGYKPRYDREYFDFIEGLGSSGDISLEHHSTNMFELISKSHLVIVYPFTSPAYIAEALGVPSIYYDPTGTVLRHDFGDSGTLINFANNAAELFNVAISVLNKNNHLRHPK